MGRSLSQTHDVAAQVSVQRCFESHEMYRRGCTCRGRTHARSKNLSLILTPINKHNNLGHLLFAQGKLQSLESKGF